MAPFIKPFGLFVVVERLPKEDKTEGGIIVPEMVQETHARARVVAVSHGVRGSDGTLHPLSVKAGMVVCFNLHSGTRIRHRMKDYIVLQEHDIWFEDVEK